MPAPNGPQNMFAKPWSYCKILRDDGLSYGDHLKQLTFLLFLKMAEEQSRPPWRKASPMAAGIDWPSLLARDGNELEIPFRDLLGTLGKEGALGSRAHTLPGM